MTPDNALSHGEVKYISKFEYFCVLLSHAGGMFGTTLTGSFAAAFLHELYYGAEDVDAGGIANILAFLLFGYTLANALKAIILKKSYDIEGEKKEQMYHDLAIMREERYKENASV